jgi:Fe-S-cluster containining protein
MVSEEDIRDWQNQITERFCRDCSANCCDANIHKIPVDHFSFPLFKEIGVPFYSIRKIDKKSLENWNKNIQADLITKAGIPIPKPSIIQARKGIFNSKWFLYSDQCPFYDEEERCTVHDDPRRPDTCRIYPFDIFENRGYTDSPHPFRVNVRRSCSSISGNESVLEELKKRFNVEVYLR